MNHVPERIMIENAISICSCCSHYLYLLVSSAMYKWLGRRKAEWPDALCTTASRHLARNVEQAQALATRRTSHLHARTALQVNIHLYIFLYYNIETKI